MSDIVTTYPPESGASQSVNWLNLSKRDSALKRCRQGNKIKQTAFIKTRTQSVELHDNETRFAGDYR